MSNSRANLTKGQVLRGALPGLPHDAIPGTLGATRVETKPPNLRDRDWQPVQKNGIRWSSQVTGAGRVLTITAYHIRPERVGSTTLAKEQEVGQFHAWLDPERKAWIASPLWVHPRYPKERLGKALLNQALELIGPT